MRRRDIVKGLLAAPVMPALAERAIDGTIIIP